MATSKLPPPVTLALTVPTCLFGVGLVGCQFGGLITEMIFESYFEMISLALAQGCTIRLLRPVAR